jgi:hypothetical protein
MTGDFDVTVDFGGGPITSGGRSDIFLAKFDSNGTHLWSQGFGDTTWESGDCVSIDPSGIVVMTGDFEGTVDFGGGNITSAGGTDIFLAKFDTNGTHLWSQGFGDSLWQFGLHVDIEPSGNVAVTGLYSGTIDFGGGNLPIGGGEDIYLAKFGPSVGVEESSEFGIRIGEFGLMQNKPNPFNKLTAISYQLQAPSHTTLQIYDITGRLVKTLVNESQEPGEYHIHWDSRTSVSVVRSGIYFYRLTCGDYTATRKLTILR